LKKQKAKNKKQKTN